MPNISDIDPSLISSAPPESAGNPAPTSGNIHSLPEGTIQTPEEFEGQKYGTLGQQALTVGEGLGQGFLGPVATGLEKAASAVGVPGLSPEEQAARARTNPVEHLGSEVAGFGAGLLTGTGEAGLLSKLGEGAIESAKAAGLSSNILLSGVRAGAELSALQTGDEISKVINQDPSQTMGNAAVNIGLAGIIGGAGGTALGAVSPLFKTAANKLGVTKLATDFQNEIRRLKPTTLAGEVTTNTPTITWETIPSSSLGHEINNASFAEKQRFSSEAAQIIKDPSGRDLLAERLGIEQPLNTPGTGGYEGQISPNQITGLPTNDPKAAENYAKSLQYIYKQDAVPYFQAHFSGEAFPSIEDLAGKNAGIIQGPIKNFPPEPGTPLYKSGSAVLPDSMAGVRFTFKNPLDPQTEDKFFSALREHLSPQAGYTKVNPNQIAVINFGGLDEPKFIDGLSKLNGRVGDELGIEKGESFRSTGDYGYVHDWKADPDGKKFPFPSDPRGGPDLQEWLHNRGQVFQELLENQTGKKVRLSPGTLLARWAFQKGSETLGSAVGEAAASGIGAISGALAGHPLIGTIIGERTLSPILKSLAKPFVEKAVDSEAMRASVDYLANAIRGEDLVNKSVKNFFTDQGTSAAASNFTGDEGAQEKLEKSLLYAANPQNMLKVGGNLGHYLPDHATAAANAAGSAVTYLNDLKPKEAALSPFDSAPPVDKAQQAKYDRALLVAQKPLTILKYAKEGRLLPQDIQTIQTIYPGLHGSIVNKLNQAIIDHKSAGKTIPYSQRVGLSMITGSYLDATMTPQSMQSILRAAGIQQQQVAQVAQSRRQSATGAQLKAIEKADTLYPTALQQHQLDKRK